MHKNITKYNAIFGGGGIKGIAYLGSISALEQYGFIINKVGGTSVGAIIASLLVMGYTSNDLIKLLNQIKLDDFTKKSLVKNIKNIFINQGLISSKPLYDLLKPLYLKKHYWYYQDIIKNNDSRLKVVTTLIKKSKPMIQEIIIPDDLKYLNINQNKFPIIDSVIMSSTYPIYFSPYKLNNQIYLDGGLKEKINLTLFENEPLLRLAFTLNKKVKEPYKKIKGGYLLQIDTKNVKTLNFKITKQEMKTLIENGYNTTLNWLQNEWFKRPNSELFHSQ